MDFTAGDDERRPSLNTSSGSTKDASTEEGGFVQMAIRSHTKSRTGCMTCKTRHIKCDETKPACERCQKGGFTCDGYTSPDLRKAKVVSQRPHRKSKAGCGNCKARRVKCDEAKPKCTWCTKVGKDCISETPKASSDAPTEDRIVSTRPIQPKKPSIHRLDLNLVLGNEREKKSFYFYVTQLGEMLSGNCDHEFWTRILTQTSCVDPAVWHSVMAVSMLQQHSISRSPEADGKDLLYHSLQHYNKAVELLTKPILDARVRSETLIIACAVFVCIEVMLGDIESSRKHIFSGVQMINDWKRQRFRAPAYQRGLMEGHMEPIFDNMVGQSEIFVWRNALEKLKQDITRFAEECRDSPSAPKSQDYAIAIARKQDFLAQSHAWLHGLEKTLERPALVDLKVDEMEGIPLLRYKHMVLHISIETLLCTTELEYDKHYSQFEKAMNLADEAFLGVMIRGPKFTTSLLPTLNSEDTPLFTIATKCRNPGIRHRALAFMKKSKNELIFRDDDLSIKVAERAVQIEEEGLENLVDETGEVVPSDWARVYDIVVEPRSGHRIHGDHRAAVSFKRRERGGGGGWTWIRGFVDYTVTKCASS